MADALRLRLARHRLRASAAASPRCGCARRATASACSSAGGASPTTSCRSSTWDLRRYFWAPRLGHAAASSGSRSSRTSRSSSGAGVGGGSLGYANTLYRAPHALLRRRAVGRRSNDWEARARAALRRGRADARRRRRTTTTTPPTSCCASTASEIGAGDDLRQDARRRLLRRAGRDRPRPVLRRRGAGPHRLHRAAGAAWSAARTAPRTRSSRTTCGSPSARGAQVTPERTVDRHPPARRAPTAPTATRSRPSAPARGCARDRAASPRARRRRRRRRARHEPAARSAAGSTARCRSVSDRLGELRAHQLRGDPRRHAARRTTPTT